MAQLWTESLGHGTSSGSPDYFDRGYAGRDGGSWVSSGGRDNGPLYTGGLIAYPQDPAPGDTTFVAGCRFTKGSYSTCYLLAAGWNIPTTGIQYIDGTDNNQCAVRLRSDGGIEILSGSDGETVLAQTAAGVWQTNTLHYLACKFVINATTGSTIVYLDGVELTDLTLTNQNTDGNGAGGWNCFEVSEQSGAQWCDLYVLDGTQPLDDDEPNDVILDARVDYLAADGNGYTSTFTGSDADSTDNYLHVDETGEHDVDSTYVEKTSTGIDAFTLENVPTSGAVIHGVAVLVEARKTDAGVATFRGGLRISGTNYPGANTKGLPLSYLPIRHNYGYNPNDNGAWEEADINGAELYIERVS